eukprot:snap_masked-scaffold_1-processed-gene-19.61-mRNA-1 protein AED:0.32 eAED:0.32 QI:0/-1/0/1/-1/1/1/0/545
MYEQVCLHQDCITMDTLMEVDVGLEGAKNALFLIFLLFLASLSSYILRQRNFTKLPESGAHLLIGILSGGLIRLFSESTSPFNFKNFNPSLFFYFLLPPIIFEAGYTMKKKDFFQNIGSILCFAVLGTFISSFTVGYLTFFAAKLNLLDIDTKDPIQALLFGSLISSVDPVAILAIVGKPENRANPLLYSLLFGESVLNDSVSIVLFHVFNEANVKKHGGELDVDQETSIGVIFARFFFISFISVIIGLCMGLACSFLFKNSQIKEYHTIEIQLLFLFVFFCFAFAELCQMSGVVALFFFAVTLSHYNFYNLSEQTQISSVYVFESLAKLSEMIIFIYVGMSIFLTKYSYSLTFFCFGNLFCVIGRALNIFPLSKLANIFRDERKISSNMQKVIFFSGLRGAVSYALSTQIVVGYTPGIQVIQTTCLTIIVVSTFALGGMTNYVLEYYGMKNLSDPVEFGGNDMTSSFMEGDERDAGEFDWKNDILKIMTSDQVDRRQGIHRLWHEVDNTILKPNFGGAEDVPLMSDPTTSRHLLGNRYSNLSQE